MSKREFKVGESDFPAPTPAHQAFREKKVEEYMHPREAYTTVPALCARAGFVAGMEAEHEVARLMGRIACLFEMTGYEHHPRVASALTRKYAEAEAQLAALLEGK